MSVLRVHLMGRQTHGTRVVEALLTDGALTVRPFTSIEVQRSETLEQALAALQGGPVQLIFADLSPAKPQDLEAFRVLQRANRDTPIILLSEFEDDDTVYQAVQLGAQDCLVQGQVEAPELVRVMRYALARSSHSEELRRSQDSFREILDGGDLPQLVADPRGQVLYANRAALKSLGSMPRRAEPAAEPGRLVFDAGVPTPAGTQETLWEGRLARLITLGGDPDEAATASPSSLFEGMASASPRMRAVFQTCERIASTRATVLILGETGTGKELVARAIHRASGRQGRFVALDCGAVPESLVDSELFGHERGAFTGATARKLGLFRHAQRGTLLLDEVGNMPLASQHSLLRVLQEGAVRPVGGSAEIPVDVRVLAASSVDLFQAVAAGRFREDLLYRLDVIRVDLLPLRERREDILHLIQLFSGRVCARNDLAPPQLGAGFLQAAVDFAWPGNVRQLENFVARALLTGVPCVSQRDFHDLVRPGGYGQVSPRPTAETAAPAAQLEPEREGTLEEFLARQERGYLERLLRQTRGSLRGVAKRAGVDTRTIQRKLKRLGIDRRRFG